MICYINRSTVDYDIRLQKYVQACQETNTPYCVIGWDRLKNCFKVYPDEYQYKVYSPYGNGFKSLFPLIGWVLFVWLYLIKKRRRYKVIHACNIENYLIACPAKWFGKKLVLDIYDSAIPKIETRAAIKCDALILPNDNRLEQLKLSKKDVKHYLEVENVPMFHEGLFKNRIVEFPKTIHLSYVGVMQKEIRGIENILSMVNDDERFVIDIAGTGDGLDQIITEMAKKNNRIHYHGKVNYQTALSIMNSSDFIVALYYLDCVSHKYASPNKYYESLYLSKPVVTTKGTLIGNIVERYNTGYTVNDTKEALIQLFAMTKTCQFMSDYIIKCQNCTERWNSVYSSYFDSVTKKKYLDLMLSL